MKIILPWPHKSLTPNAKRRLHWSKYRGFALADRKTGYWSTFDQLAHGIRDVRARIASVRTLSIAVHFIPPDRRRRDDDSMIGAFKHLRDGMCDALGIDDVILRPAYTIGEPESPGRVEVKLG